MKHGKSKQKSSKDERKAAEARACSMHMRQFMNGYRALLEARLRADGLTLPQLRMLKATQQQADVSAAALARTCMVTPQTLQAMLGRAVQAKWIVRGKSARNGRIVTAKLTGSGDAVLRQGMEAAAQIEERMWRGVGLSELRQVNAVLEAGIANLGGEA